MIVITCLHGEIYQNNCVHEEVSLILEKSSVSLMRRKHSRLRFDLQALFSLTRTLEIRAVSPS